MTPKETLDELERLREAGAAVGWRKGTRAEYVTACYCAAPDLIADSRALHELVDALEKCHEEGCLSIATYSWHGGDGAGCDAHTPPDRRWPDCELPYAAILRRVT